MKKKVTYLRAGYYGSRGRMGRRRVEILLRDTMSNGCKIALVRFLSGKEPPRWVAERDIIS